ncbi:MAG TPA: heparinase II/III family protein [Vicinamibacterales bacterium]|nr:heparinase II/III family protein [Vicinamibacterales bacterium]
MRRAPGGRRDPVSPDRRGFLRDLAAGTAGLAVGGAPARAARRPGRQRGPVFPFHAHASRYDIGEYLPKDQGGKFIQMALVGSEADAAVVEAIRGGVLERTYGDPIGWSRFEKSAIERSVWLNRFYYLPPFARLFRLTGDRRFLDDMMRIVSRWTADNPRPSASAPATHIWRDMQVAWRSIHLSWCSYLGGEGLRDEEKLAISRLLQDHADVLLAGFGRQPLNEFNHQSHGALAMLYLGTLFPNLAGAASLRQTALAILTHHLERAFFADGGNVEQMFGYYPFEAHIFRDAYLLCVSNGVEPPAGTVPALKRMAAFLAAVAQPDGTMPQVNDSYEMPVDPTLETLDGVLRGEGARRVEASTRFPDTQIAVLRDSPGRKWYVLANAAQTIGAHAHAGRLAVNVWFNGKPVLVDSGCCDYDDPALVTWFRTTGAHNTVMIDGRSDRATSSDALWAPRRQTANRIPAWDVGEGHVYCRMQSPAEEETNAGVAWSRSIALVRDLFVVIHDCFEAVGAHHYKVLFRFPSRGVVVNRVSKSLVVKGADGVHILPAAPEAIEDIALTLAPLSVKGATISAPVAACSFKRDGIAHSLFVIVPGADDEPGATVRQTATNDGIVLSVAGERFGEAVLLFAGDRMRIVRL